MKSDRINFPVKKSSAIAEAYAIMNSPEYIAREFEEFTEEEVAEMLEARKNNPYSKEHKEAEAQFVALALAEIEAARLKAEGNENTE